MKVVEFHSISELEALRPLWSSLLAQSKSDTVFLTWEWMSAWWSSYAQSDELRFLAAYDDAGELRGIAPLRRRTLQRYGQSIPALAFIGDGSNDSDYLDFIIAAGYEDQVLRAFAQHLAGDVEGGAVLCLNEIPAASPNEPLLRATAQTQKLLWSESDVPCGTVPLPETWDEYLRVLKPRFRTKVRSTLRQLEAQPEARFGFCETMEDVTRLLPVLYDLHTRRWAQNAKTGVFGWDRKRVFYETLSPILLKQGWLRFSWLEWKGKILACQYGFTYNGVYSQLQEGYEPAAEHWNPGVGLRAWTIREFLKQNVREYDFLGGIGRHKTDWGASTKLSKRILTGKATGKNILFFRGPEWEERARGVVKQMVPGKVLAARQAYLQRKQEGQFGAGQAAPPSSADWVRNAAANCYFRLGIPTLIRSLRDQYQLSLGNGARRGVSLSKRNQACGRILYYHRVNDQNDPFFPAMSTDLFSREMEYLARNYTVVSLSDMVKRLDNGTNEMLVAVTFDDGYYDNYLNAFPILQRYGVPATIFLATGAIDTREPLWFETLALALKKTTCEYIDIGIDVPRRLYLRDEGERLAANDRIFGLLRQMDEAARKHSLEEILGVLAAGKLNDRAGVMLTWDQVRAMKAKGIDFGGHTVTHPFVSKLTPEGVAWEAAECKRRIEQELQCGVQHFAYPNGREEDIGASKDLIRSAGYTAAVTTMWGMNYSTTDRMELRRGGPWEKTAAMFAYKFDWYQLVND